jgi:hypothetical protein
MSNFNSNYYDADSPNNVIISDPATPTQQVSVSVNGDLGVADGLSNGGVFGNLLLSTANTAYEAKVGGSRLALRKTLMVTALDDMYWGFSNAVTTSTGTPLFKNQQLTFSIDPNASTFQVWLVAGANSKNARIVESP